MSNLGDPGAGGEKEDSVFDTVRDGVTRSAAAVGATQPRVTAATAGAASSAGGNSSAAASSSSVSAASLSGLSAVPPVAAAPGAAVDPAATVSTSLDSGAAASASTATLASAVTTKVAAGASSSCPTACASVIQPSVASSPNPTTAPDAAMDRSERIWAHRDMPVPRAHKTAVYPLNEEQSAFADRVVFGDSSKPRLPVFRQITEMQEPEEPATSPTPEHGPLTAAPQPRPESAASLSAVASSSSVSAASVSAVPPVAAAPDAAANPAASVSASLPSSASVSASTGNLASPFRQIMEMQEQEEESRPTPGQVLVTTPSQRRRGFSLQEQGVPANPGQKKKTKWRTLSED